TNDLVLHRDRAHPMAAQEVDNLLADVRILAHIAPVAEPLAQIEGFCLLCSNDPDGYLAGSLVVRTVECDGTDGIAAEPLRLLFQPFHRIAAQRHSLSPF